MSTYRLDKLFSPSSIAVVGASPRGTSPGHAVLKNLRLAGFTGAVHLVNPHYDAIEGVAAVKSYDALPGAPDLAVIAVPPPSVPAIVAAAAKKGTPAGIILTAGQSGDVTTAPALLDSLRADAVLADKAYDSNALRALIAAMGAIAVIPSNRTRRVVIPHDAEAYKHRNRIERCFNRLKHFRRFATRYDRRAIHFLAFIQIAAAMIWLR